LGLGLSFHSVQAAILLSAARQPVFKPDLYHTYANLQYFATGQVRLYATTEIPQFPWVCITQPGQAGIEN
jgi:hypothetical protein